MAATLPASIANLVKPTISLSCADTAKLVRKALKEAFPEVRFSVRSNTYAGGASIDVSWGGGPTAPQVERFAKAFAGASFDGMTDSKSLHTAAVDGQPTRFGADYVFCHRRLDEQAVDALVAIVSRVDRGDWFTLALGAGLPDDLAALLAQHHKDASDFARMVLRNVPVPRFEGRSSRTAGIVNRLD